MVCVDAALRFFTVVNREIGKKVKIRQNHPISRLDRYFDV
jgi:hypothetical protein